jgi:hypothetical protein
MKGIVRSSFKSDKTLQVGSWNIACKKVITTKNFTIFLHNTETKQSINSYFFVADWHAFTTHYSDKIDLEFNVTEMVVD